MDLCVFSCILKKGGFWNEVWNCRGWELRDHVHEMEFCMKVLGKIRGNQRSL